MRYNGERTSAHRFSWEAFNERGIPAGMVVMHTCDTPMCVNPDHLRIGTQKENMKDRDVKGRQRNGNRFSRLPGHLIVAIQNDHWPIRDLSKRYGISVGCAYNVKHRRNKCYQEESQS